MNRVAVATCVLAATGILLLGDAGEHNPQPVSPPPASTERSDYAAEVHERDSLEHRLREILESQSMASDPTTLDYDKKDLGRGIDPPTRIFPD